MDHPYGLLSFAPPLVAIVLAIATRRPVLSLLFGIYCGALVTTSGDPFEAVAATCETHLWPTLIDPGKMRVFAFTLLMAGMIGVISRSGGMHGLIQLITPLAKTRRSGQVTTWVLGLVIFFDDYANTILLGGTLRPLCDRLKISREKLAYLVDSTAAPIASVALLSTWIAVEVDYIGDGISGIEGGSEFKAMELFIASIPFRFYALMALLMVLLIALSGRDFGPMLAKERQRVDPSTEPAEDVKDADDSDPVVASGWYNAAAPIGLTLAVVVWLLYETGGKAFEEGSSPRLRDILGEADSSLALQYGALAGLALAAFLARVQGLLDSPAILRATGNGMRIVLPAIAILWTASALSRMTGNEPVHESAAAALEVEASTDKSDASGKKGNAAQEQYPFRDHRLYTGDYLAGLMIPDNPDQAEENGNTMLMKFLPTIIFLLAAVLSFSTGTSFGTMGLLMPMTIPLTYNLLSASGATVTASDPLLLACIASVLTGAVFGDHCSPISDTTILSSQACLCDHISHVITQLPYACVVGIVTILLGTIPLGFGVSIWLLLPLQLLAMIAIVMLFGKKVS